MQSAENLSMMVALFGGLLSILSPCVLPLVPAYLSYITGISYNDLSSPLLKRSQRSKVVFLNFWASWCLPCRAEMPSMEKLYNKFKNSDFAILAVNLGEGKEQVKAFKELYSLNFPILLDADSSVGSIYGAISIPTSYLIDRDGYMIGGALGPRDWASEEAFELVNSLLKKSPESL